MRLTNDIRDRIVRSVIADLPQRNWQAEADAIVLPAAVARLPDIIRRSWNDGTTRLFIKTATVWVYGSNLRVEVPSDNTSIAQSERVQVIGDDALAAFEALCEQHATSVEQRQAIKRELHASLANCTTVKQVRERYPDLAPYLPNEATVPNLPATTAVIDKLREAGWPVDRQAA